MKKRMQIDAYNELPKEKRPTDDMIWWGSPKDIENWFDKVFNRKGKTQTPEVFQLDISEDEIG
jgi:hypothetical protein